MLSCCVGPHPCPHSCHCLCPPKRRRVRRRGEITNRPSFPKSPCRHKDSKIKRPWPRLTLCLHFPWKQGNNWSFSVEPAAAAPPGPIQRSGDGTGILNQAKWLLWCQAEITNLSVGQQGGTEPWHAIKAQIEESGCVLFNGSKIALQSCGEEGAQKHCRSKCTARNGPSSAAHWAPVPILSPPHLHPQPLDCGTLPHLCPKHIAPVLSFVPSLNPEPLCPQWDQSHIFWALCSIFVSGGTHRLILLSLL